MFSGRHIVKATVVLAILTLMIKEIEQRIALQRS